MSSVHLLCLLLVLGVGMALGHPSNMISQRMRKAHQSIANKLKLTQAEISGKPLFKHAKSTEPCQQKNMQLMNATLDVYMSIFSNMLTHWHDLDKDLSCLKNRTAELKERLSRIVFDTEDNVGLLNKIKVDDLNHQKRALAQFLEVYHEAAMLQADCLKNASLTNPSDKIKKLTE